MAYVNLTLQCSMAARALNHLPAAPSVDDWKQSAGMVALSASYSTRWQIRYGGQILPKSKKV